MPVNIRILQFLPISEFRSHPQLMSLVNGDANHDFQIDDTEAETQMIREMILSNLQAPPDPNNPQAMTQFNNWVEQFRQREMARDQGQTMRTYTQRWQQSAQAFVAQYQRTQMDLTPVYTAPATAGIQQPQSNELRSMDANHDHTLTQQEVETYLRSQIERASRASSGAAPAAPNADNLAAQAQAFLYSQVPEMLRNIAALDQNSGRIADQIPTQIDALDLNLLQNLTDTQRTSHNLIRITLWMQSRLETGQTVLNSARVHELLNTRAIDLFSVSQAVNQMQPPPDGFTQFLSRFSPHYIVTEDQLVEAIRTRSLNIGALTEAARNNPALASILQASTGFTMLNEMAGENHILEPNDFERLRIGNFLRTVEAQNQAQQRQGGQAPEELRQRLVYLEAARNAGYRGVVNQAIIDAVRARYDQQHASTPPPWANEAFLMEIFYQFNETRENNPMHGHILGEPEIIRVQPDRFLSRVMVVLAYTLPTQANNILVAARNSAVLALAEVLLEGLHAEERAHASDSVPGVTSMGLSAITSPAALVQGTGNLLFSSQHQFTSSIWNRGWTRDWVRNHADGRHQERAAALTALRTVMRDNQSLSVIDGIERLRQQGGTGATQATLLTDELHLPEVERIYSIPNDRTREESWLRFCSTLRGGQWVASHGNLLGTMFLSPWQTRNGPTSAAIYERLMNTSTSEMVRTEARNSGIDQVGNGGSMFPTFWFRNWADSEASFDGVWDETIGSGTLVFASIYGMRLFGMARTPGFFTEMPNDAWRTSSSIFTRTGYWGARALTAIPRNITRLPPDSWRTAETLLEDGNWVRGRLLQGSYWGLRGLGTIPRFIFPRSLQGAELELALNEGVRWAQASNEVGGFRGFIYRQMAQLRASNLGVNPNAQEGARRILQIAGRITQNSETAYEAILPEARSIEGLVATDPEEALRRLRNVRRLASNAAGMHEVAINSQIPLGMTPQGLQQAQTLRTIAQNIRSAAERLENNSAVREQLIEYAEGLEMAVTRSAQGSRGYVGHIGTAAASLEAQHAAQQQQGQLFGTLLLWSYLHERALIATDRRNPADLESPLPGMDPASAIGVARRSARVRGSRASFGGSAPYYVDFELGPVPNYLEVNPPAPQARPTGNRPRVIE
ncbi:MAG: hypothetical protein U1F57_01090 [bacterium]